MKTKDTKSKADSGRSAEGACSAAVIERLLDAAFRELQHDTGPQNVEYVHSRNLLSEQFRKILRKRPNATSAATSRENEKPTTVGEQTGGELAAAPCSAGDGDIEKLRPIQHEIINELSRAFDRLGAERGVFAALHSWGDTMPESEVLAMLRDQNEISTSTSSTQV